MRPFLRNTVTLCFISLSLVGCTTKDQLKKLFVENPDILLEAFEKNPQKFADVFNKLGNQARQAAQGKTREQELAKREEDFRNPKTPEIDKKRAIKGPASAPITIVAYSDFQCPFCGRAEETIGEIEKKYGNKVRYVFKNFPLPFHPFAMPAAKRYEAIALQSKEKAIKFHDEVFKNQNQMTAEKEAFLDKVAAKVGADVAKMKKDMEGQEVKSRIEADTNEGRKFGVSGTPAFLINGVALFGARPVADFDEVIQRWMNQGKREVSNTK